MPLRITSFIARCSQLIRYIHRWRQKHPTLSFFLAVYLCYKFCQRLFDKPISLSNRVVVITGGASGIGRLVALRLKDLNARVIVWDINDEALRVMQPRVDGTDHCNVADEESVKKCATNVLREFGRVDILINNAGIVMGKRMLELSADEIRRSFNVNAVSHFFTLQAFLPGMQNRNSGHVVTIASTAGRVGIAGLSDYCGSKFAARGIEDAVRDEVTRAGYSGITFSQINPYFIDTGMFTGARGPADFVAALVADFLEPNYVAAQIVHAIQFREREVVLPRRLGVWLAFEHFFPQWLADRSRLVSADMSTFVGH